MESKFSNLSPGKQHGLAFLIIFIIMVIYFWPMIFQNMGPAAEDTQAWEGASRSIRDYNATHPDFALWATNLFAGMPAANISVPIPVHSFDDALKSLKTIGLPWQFMFFVVGGFFFYFFLRLLGLSWIPSLFGAVIFVMLPHHIGLINAGHNTKIRAIMFAPMVASAFIYFVKKTSLFSFACIALALALIVRTNHYQIVYYTGFLIIFLGLPYIITYIKENTWGILGKKIGLFLLAVIASGIIAAPKMVLTQQYLPYSIRGASGETKNTAKGGGLDIDYATQWSFAPEEILTFVIPNYFGGSSSYKYTGNAVPQLKGRTIPGYWGPMPFTSTTQYLGILTVFLAMLGAIGFWKNGMVRSLLALIALALLISFGRHFPPVFDFFFKFAPLFNKFRVPSMILFLVRFTVPVLAAYGIAKILELATKDWKNALPVIGGAAGVLLLIGIIPLLFGGQFALMKASEAQQYQPQTLQLLKSVRLDMLKTDSWRLIIFIILGGGAIFAFLRHVINVKILIPILGVLILIDMYGIDTRYLRDFVKQQPHQVPIRKTQIDNAILQDSGMFRVFPVGKLFQSNRWAYFHQSIGGYHAAKMYRYQKMIEENLYHSTEPGNSINWNIVKLLNVKYLITTGQIRSNYLTPIGQDQNTKWILYQVKNSGPRAWMVYHTRVIAKDADQRNTLNSADFHPMEEAIVGTQLLPESSPQDTAGVQHSVELTHFDANHIDVKIQTAKPGLLVLSENYLPIWWHATLDGKPVKIQRVNSFQRGIVVPQGTHTMKMVIEAKVFHASIISANVLVWIIHIIILVYLIQFIPGVKGVFKRQSGE